MGVRGEKVILSSVDGKHLIEGSCESTDTKPTDWGINSRMLELDTGDFYYFDGSDWNKVGGE